MPIKRPENFKKIGAIIDTQYKKKTEQLLKTFAFVGEQCVVEARESGSYMDQTGNLRSSIGYVVFNEGAVYKMSAFEQVKEGKLGAINGKSYATSLASQFPNSIALVVVAGMNYASYVSAKGYDVLDTAELKADELVPSLLEKLGFIKR